MGKSPEKDASLDNDNDTGSNLQTTVKADEILVFGLATKIYGLRKEDDARIWRADAPTGITAVRLSMFVTNDNRLVVGGSGRTACIDLRTGQIKWPNKMPVIFPLILHFMQYV
ncbi:hypothetical protein BJV82DRAFT_603396 [Fennellomyces sp. T-0311]|nr:hypothetical protein BJV82DRAFT_603396 [Fennellomyces sp. T-0311]